MKIAISAKEPSLDAQIDPRFGRCAYFIILDPESLKVESIRNASGSLGGGAGIQAAQLVIDKGVQYVLTGNCGPKAHEVLTAAAVGVIVGCSGSVKGVVEKFIAGELLVSTEPNAPVHSGMVK